MHHRIEQPLQSANNIFSFYCHDFLFVCFSSYIASLGTNSLIFTIRIVVFVKKLRYLVGSREKVALARNKTRKNKKNLHIATPYRHKDGMTCLQSCTNAHKSSTYATISCAIYTNEVAQSIINCIN